MRLIPTLTALLMLAPSLAHGASVTVTIGAPGAMEADLAALGATGALVETFDGLGPGTFANYDSVLGTYSAGRVSPATQYGGADATQYLFSLTSPGSVLSLDGPATYFGLWWSAGSVGNQVDLLSGGSEIFSFNTDDVLDFLGSNAPNVEAYFGNPTDQFEGRVRHEPFVFINMFSDMAFDTVVLSGPNFESDNHTVAQHYAQETGTEISAVPLPAALPFLVCALGALALAAQWRRRRHWRARGLPLG